MTLRIRSILAYLDDANASDVGYEIVRGAIFLPASSDLTGQSQVDGFARYCLYNGLLNLGAQKKMRKSIGNTLLITELVKRWRPVELRHYLVAPRYRSALEYAEEAIDKAAARPRQRPPC